MTPLPSRAAETLPNPSSIYGATKLAQEHVCRAWCASHDIAFSTLRLQNVYGPGQMVGNPYVGVLPYFASQAMSGGTIAVYEDGEIVRDFVYVADAVEAIALAIENRPRVARCVDVGSGRITTILEIAQLVAKHWDGPDPQVSGAYRLGDVRAATCDVDAARRELGFEPRWKLEDGIAATVEEILLNKGD